ncbi:putative acetyltransferase [Pseudobythopirellula maris]|uniref:Putative acetyltransferase n=1 Tax=Pseudobythopirellula maris TaxID=2527991 RepID=A0A5C5ZNM1_9BACT|nr:GNAT family N-acetyltransferase [Pseudobythopirellula maris]TWT89049.1 putative acetyltransferase [Pseudobythopirellula maris]
MDEITIIEADLAHEDHQLWVLAMEDAYAADPLGNGGPIDPEARERLLGALAAHPTTMIWLAMRGGTNAAKPVGIAVCFLGFSTFAAKPLINVHDLSVIEACRGRGVGRQLLAAVAAKGRELGCCRLTLEVLEHNPARRLYESAGFKQATYAEDAGGALFMMKPL